jgi:hypothetical protein
LTSLLTPKDLLICFSEFLRLTALYVEVAVNEVALVRTQYAQLMAEKDLETMECLLACLQSIQEWSELFTTFDYPEYIGMPFGIWKQLALMLYTSVRLATLDDPAWDTEQVRRAVDLPGLMNHVSVSMSHVGNLAPWKQNADNVHSRSSKLMATLTTWSKSVYDGTIPTEPIEMPSPAPFAPPNRRESSAMRATTANNNNDINPLPMMNGNGTPQVPSDAAAAAFAQQQEQQGPNLGFPDMFPYFNQEPWTDDVFGFWDLWNVGRAPME